MLQEIFACFVSCLHWKAIFIAWKYFYSWILAKSYLYKTSIWPEVLYKFDLVVTHLQIRLSRNSLTSNFKCWATKANYLWQTDFVLYWMPEPTKRNQNPLSPWGARIYSKCSIWFPSIRLTYQNHWSDSRVIQQVFRNYYSLPCWDGLRL